MVSQFLDPRCRFRWQISSFKDLEDGGLTTDFTVTSSYADGLGLSVKRER